MIFPQNWSINLGPPATFYDNKAARPGKFILFGLKDYKQLTFLKISEPSCVFVLVVILLKWSWKFNNLFICERFFGFVLSIAKKISPIFHLRSKSKVKSWNITMMCFVLSKIFLSTDTEKCSKITPRVNESKLFWALHFQIAPPTKTKRISLLNPQFLIQKIKNFLRPSN